MHFYLFARVWKICYDFNDRQDQIISYWLITIGHFSDIISYQDEAGDEPGQPIGNWQYLDEEEDTDGDAVGPPVFKVPL